MDALPATSITVGTAWQRQIRDSIAGTEGDRNTYSQDIGAAEVRRIDISVAREVIEEYEWLGRMPAVVLFAYGIYFGPDLGGVVTYSPEYGENLGVWDKYGYTGKIILLSRGACVWWAHPHAASKLIRKSMDLLPDRYEVVTATVDAGAGEVGTIYQACSFDYVGRMTKISHQGAFIDGKLRSSRQLMREFGTRSIRKLQQRFGEDAIKAIEEPSKGRYFAFPGGKIARKHNRAAIAHLIKPYPHRDPGADPAGAYEGKT